MGEECAAGQRPGWHEFVRDYAPLARALVNHYFPLLAPEIDSHIQGLFQRAQKDGNAWFRDLKFHNEREFMIAFRDLVFGYGRANSRIPAPELSLDQMREIMRSLNVVEREILWLFVKGYTAAQIAPIMMNAAATANAVRAVADEKLAQVLPGATAQAFNVSARVLTEAAEKTKTDACLPLRTFNNLVNGQLSWRERELAEEHIRDCFYCIDRFTSFQEMTRLRKDTAPLPEAEIESLLTALQFPPAGKKGFLERMFAKA